ncbi:hypothetical protein [Noviherbaspirillum soli]|uniref:hypothetical protein n=1 Tax=Noviherbaspirillum soli TaxID=1064518 RepID=UPI00188A2EBF|nr:hypothetical protein [Noviherbaspirillum soli]
MSRLFSQLENIGHDRTDVERPAASQEAGTAGAPPASAEARPHNLSAAPSAAADVPSRPNYGSSSTASSQIPGYAIASQLSLSSRPAAPAEPSRTTWPVRLWFLSLLALIGLSLAMLLSPRDDTTAAQRAAPRPAGIAPEPTEDDEPSLPPVQPAPPAKAMAAVENRPTTAAASVAKPADKPVARRQLSEPSQPLADSPATPPRAPAGDAGCSAAMAAMNLCSASHP